MLFRRISPFLVAAVPVLVLVTLMSACGSGSSSGPTSSSATAASGPAAQFLASYVTDDGRVLRHDQGDDIVSEGQAYGMLIAEYAGRADVARTIWSWTQHHLLRADGLLAYHADEDGKVLDSQPAADADTLAAYALLSYSGPEAASLHDAGRKLARSVLAQETVTDPGTGPVLVAGPWAQANQVVNPSYWMPGVFADLARLTGDDTWSQMASSSVRLVDASTDHGGRLPADWGTLESGRVVPSGSGGGSGTPQYGPDAQRVPLWFATACDPTATDLAARWWRVLQQGSRSSALALDLDGTPIDGSGTTVALLASAASARAAGDRSGAAQLRQGSEQSNQGSPTYYGSAWLALSQALQDGSIGGCD